MSLDKQIVKIRWSIKGYHIFHVKPHEDLELLVIPDLNNHFDNYAMKVMCPGLQEISEALLDAPLPQQHRGRSAVTVSDIAGESFLHI